MELPAWIQALESADDACRRQDLPTLARVARQLIAVAHHDLQYDLVAVAELAALGEPSAIPRWRHQLHLLRDTSPRDASRASVHVAA